MQNGSLALGGDDDAHLRLDLTSCTYAEKDLGIRVARAAQKLRAWCAEIQLWGWNNSFGPDQYGDQPTVGSEAGDGSKSVQDIEVEMSDMGSESRATNNHRNHSDAVSKFSYGTQSAANNTQRQSRLDQIQEELHDLEYQELKDHVLGLHHAGSRPGSSYSDVSMHHLMMMDDYTILVTHILMQSLPSLLLLQQIVDTWRVRLSVLASCPQFLRELNQVKHGMTLAWQILSMPSSAKEHGLNARTYQQAVSTVKTVLQKKLSGLGRALDGMLDELEGRSDKLPDRWIDDFEALEVEYSEWTSKAQQSMFQLEMQEERRRQEATQKEAASTVTRQSPPRTSRSPVALRVKIPTEKESDSDVEVSRQDDSDTEVSHQDLSATSDAIGGVRQPGAPESVAHAPVAATAVRMRRASLTSIRSISSTDIRRISVVRSPSISGNATPLKSQPNADEPQTPITPISPYGIASRSSSNLHVPTTPLATTHEEPAFVEETPTQPIVEIAKGATQESSATVSLPDTHEAVELDVPEAPISIISSVHDFPLPPQARPVTPNMPKAASFVNEPRTPASLISLDANTPSPQDSPSKRAGWKPQPGALNSAMTKRRNKFKENLGTKSGIPEPTGLHSPTQSSSRFSSVPQDMEQQISSILTTLPTPIRLESKRKASNNLTAPSNRSKVSTLTQPLRRSRAPSLTLARAATPLPQSNDERAAPSTTRMRKSGSSEEPEIQLYHLSSSKGLAPTKLYIRRVGENGERLMVRVGGGWADLAEYLQHYADHHGRRAVSGSHETVQVLDMENGSPSSSPASAHHGHGDSPSSVTGARHVSAGAKLMLGGDSSSLLGSSSSNVGADVQALREQTPQSATSNGSRRSLGGADLGSSLAGPRIKKLDLSGEKQEWIDGMVEKAKKANSADNRRDKDADRFTDIGKIGGTKRVFMKGP